MKRDTWVAMLPYYLLAVILMIGVARFGSDAVTVIGQGGGLKRSHIFIIDAGHGYPDGGATSCTGVLESEINLQIAVRLNDLLHFLGYETLMTRTNSDSIYTEGESIAAKKVSDLKERVRIVNTTENAILISIHQNTYPDSRYGGPQVLYATKTDSKDLASSLQFALKNVLDPSSRRAAKKGSGVYLMEQINKAGVLVECGFISNPEEEAKLRKDTYQKTLCAVIATAVAGYLQSG